MERRASRSSSMERGRRVGSTWRQRISSASSASGTSGRSARAEGGALVSACITSPARFLAGRVACPVSARKRIEATA